MKPATYLELWLLMSKNWYEFEYLKDAHKFREVWLWDNVHIYHEVERVSRIVKNEEERDHYGFWMIANDLRWNSPHHEEGTDYKLSNGAIAFLTRLVMFRNPDLQGMFRIKRPRA